MNKKLIVIASVLIFVFNSGFAQSQKKIFTEDYITSTVEKACDWQLNNLFSTALLATGRIRDIPETGWIRGVFYTGVMAAYRVTEQERYLDSAYVWGQNNRWQLGHRIKHADDQVVAQTYADLYEIYQNSSIIEPTIHRFNYMIETPEPGPVVGYSNNKNWSWCDALYMAPPAMVKVGVITDNPEFLYLMNSMWWETYFHLYSEEDSLFYRDAHHIIQPDGSGRRTESGKKVFWGRGNGWVIAGLAKILTWLPEDYTTRPAFEEVYLEMASKIASLQQEDGFWRSSLYDPNQFNTPETSSSGFFCFALAWGINEGLLDKEQYLPVVKKSWQGLNEAMDESGKLGYVQQVGSSPASVTKDDSMEYGTAAYLLAAEQVLKLVRTGIIN
jgi:unsaturated rhamnogalacturonyl hydrolase